MVRAARCNSAMVLMANYPDTGLSAELRQVDEYCTPHALSVTVSTVDIVSTFTDLKTFVELVPVQQRHRLATYSTSQFTQTLRYRALRFSSASHPVQSLGTTGDLWVCTDYGHEAVYHRTVTAWEPWPRPQSLQHPFITIYNPRAHDTTQHHPLPLFFSGDAVVWSSHYGNPSNMWYLAHQGQCKEFTTVTIPDIVQFLYEPSGRPKTEPSGSYTSTTFGSAVASNSTPQATGRSSAPDVPPIDSTPLSKSELESGSRSVPVEELPLYHKCSRHPTLWYSEGSIVVKVDNTLYRLFRTYLTRHSELFADALAKPVVSSEAQSDATNVVPKVEDCPVVEVRGLSPTDFESWVATLEDGM